MHWFHSLTKNSLPLLLLLTIVVSAIATEAPVSKTAPAKAADPSQKAAKKKTTEKKEKDPYAWKTLFDGKTLKGWKTPDFGSDGKVSVEKGSLILGKGDGVTGVTIAGKPPRTNYEIEFQAKRLAGNDFFGTVTIPVGKEHCSVVIGGWGGTLVGISSIHGFDASENSTTRNYRFKNDTWYTIRVRTSDARIEAWVNKDRLVDLRRSGEQFDTRLEVDDCCPLGIASWCTKAAIRNIRLRKLRPEEIRAAAKLRKDEIGD